MQRDLGNEVIVAIIVVGVLAFALTFGIILSLSNNGLAATGVAQSSTAADTAVSTDEPPTAETSVATATLAPSATFTATLTATPSAAPSLTPTTSATPTATLTASATVTLTHTVSATATATLTPTHTATLTPTVSATPTATLMLTATATATRTLPPSSTPTQTAAVVPSATHTPAATLTPEPTTVPASSTPLPTRRPTQTRTPTPVMDAQPIVTAATATATAPPVCVVPFGWVTYTVQAGDSLASIAARNGITIMQLLQGNCLSVNETVTPGSMVYVPSFPTQATRPDSSSQQFVAQGCTDPYVLILSPVPGQRISGLYFIRGTANPANFAYYRLELRPDSVNVFSFYARSEQAVDNGVLGSIDTTAFSPGLYWLRLSIIDRSGGVSAAFCTVPVFFE